MNEYDEMRAHALVLKMRKMLRDAPKHLKSRNERWLKENAKDIHRGMMSAAREFQEQEDKYGDRVWGIGGIA